MGRISFLKAIAIMMMVFCTFKCNSDIRDEDIKSQVTDYLTTLQLPGFARNIPFSEFFELTNIVVNDRLIKGKECVVICNVNVKVKKNYDRNSLVAARYGFVAGPGSGTIGEIRSNNIKFMFEKYEKGWRIKEHMKI